MAEGQLEEMKQALEQLSRPVQPRVVHLGGFLAGLLTCAVVIGILYYRYHYSIWRFSKRRQQREAVRQLSQMDAQELRQLLGEVDLPSWIRYPDFQRVQWLNTVMMQLWPYAAQYTTTWAEDNVPKLLEESKPAWMREIKLHYFSLGPAHPEPLGVKVYSEAESRNDEIILEFDFVWAGQQEISVVVKPLPRAATHAVTRMPVAQQIVDMLSNMIAIKVAIERLTMNGCLRVTLRPLSSQLPLMGSAQVAFTEMPKFSFDLTVYGGDVSILPGLETWLHGLIRDQVLQPYVLPEKFVIPLQNVASPDFDRPRALLQVQVVEAEHVPRMDIFSKSDPFVELYVRSKNKVKTQVIANSHRPQWHEAFNLLVHYPETQSLVAKMYDYDEFDKDDEIGRVEMSVRDLPWDQELDEWFEVEPPHQERPAAQKYQQTKVVGTLIRPWESKLLKPGLWRKKHKCRLRLKITLHEFPEEAVDAVAAAHHEPAGPDARHEPAGPAAADSLQRMSPAVRRALQGGVLCLRILRVEGLVGKAWLLGGWKSDVQVRVWFAGEQKATLSMRGKRGQASVDQELEFVVDGYKAHERGRRLEVEVWDTHWRSVFQGRAIVEFDRIRDAQLWRSTVELQQVAQGRIALEAQWTPLLAERQGS